MSGRTQESAEMEVSLLGAILQDTTALVEVMEIGGFLQGDFSEEVRRW